MRKKSLLFICILFFFTIVFARQILAQSDSTRSITLVTEPDAKVWIDEVLRGKTDANGKLTIKTIPPGIRKLRIRANGFKENLQTLTAVQKGDLNVELAKTSDEAELSFQQADVMAGRNREKAVELYRKSIKLRPAFAEAHLGLVRVLSEAGKDEEALQAIVGARKVKPIFPEISAIEGRIYKSLGDEEKAIAAFKRSIREGKGYQPEAFTGLGLLYKERAETLAAEGDLDSEKTNYDLATTSLRTAISQLGGAPDAEIIYQMLGVAYEKQHKYVEAIKLYEEFLRLFPDSNEVTAIRSFITQAKKRMDEEQ